MTRSETPPLELSEPRFAGFFALIYAHAALTARIDALLTERHQITFSAFEVFCRLRESEEPQAMRSLARLLVSVSPTRASRIVQEHIDAGHLARAADQTDGRISLISFTDAGRRYADAASRTFEQAIDQHFAGVLDEEDMNALLRIWEKLRQTSNSGPPPRR
ncbi:MarR family winged helix-turn-helix transcriptional regulator [Streptomyces griseoflavus]|uniref:MarR family transcriptional regulator n=1 Tax=Streptomyces griseoflavus Tu4000 TaxID=467200 RepID=D9Y1E8_9ACTN|nr:MarR family transcriptional regulator [Streptomyces griseoflavus]EFL40032.1 MarR family transcriptional regulator [Streptomyces griseoflavus Tu4000]